MLTHSAGSMLAGTKEVFVSASPQIHMRATYSDIEGNQKEGNHGLLCDDPRAL